MSDTSSLRAILNQTEVTMPSIQASSRAMMSFYDRPGGGATLAVSEWRSVLQTSSPSQSMPLLYVANEVIQTSKRNRGSKFLEAFSPVLGSSMIFICSRDNSVVEKVRRTVKIWGDRRIFSMRFVMEVLAGLEPYREGGSESRMTLSKSPSPVPLSEPKRSPKDEELREPVSNASDEDDDMFEGGNEPKLLDISIDATKLTASSRKRPNEKRDSVSGSDLKRRRSSLSNKPKALSGQNFLDLFQSVVSLDEKYKSCLSTIESIPASYLDDECNDVDDLVGDELTDMYKKVSQAQRNVRREKRTMFSVAVQRHELEKEARRYVGWLKNLAQVDNDDLALCEKLEKELDVIAICHDEAKSLHEQRLTEEAKKRAQAELKVKQQQEEEERQRILSDAKAEAEAKPGMRWNKELREYEYIKNTEEESWRD
mmetsp:Transcript_30617/g.72865  ORF Transcript_30617/g.72865 Transcript_30617/m.72865 type:complete len:426 (+) Transcript_30617:92-1369(+)